VKPVEVEGVKEWEVEKILNKRKVRGVLWDALDMNNFYFLFLLFSDFIGIFVFFFFLFSFG